MNLNPTSAFTVLLPLSIDAHDSTTRTANQIRRFRNARSQAPGQNNLPFVKVSYLSLFPHTQFFVILNFPKIKY